MAEFCYITDDTYTKRQVLRMEQLVLGVLHFECAPPTAHFFVTFMAKLADCGPKTTALAQYLTELTMIDGEKFHLFLPKYEKFQFRFRITFYPDLRQLDFNHFLFQICVTFDRQSYIFQVKLLCLFRPQSSVPLQWLWPGTL